LVPGRAGQQIEAAQALLWAGDIDGARARLDALLEADGEPAAHFLRGMTFYADDRLEDACRDWEAAFQGFRQAGASTLAARAAMGLAELHVSSLGNDAAGQGWLGRARRLLDRAGPCVEEGWFEIALMACTRPDVDDLLASADRALEIALEYGDPDLEVRALADGGLALVSQGRLADGFARLDEALAAITGGQLRDPSVAGAAFCALLSSCDRSGDLRRAEEWSRLIERLLFERLGDRPRVLHTHCRVAYGSVLWSAGQWQEAERVMLEALGPGASRSVGHRIDVTAHLAELRLDQGRIEEAAQLVGPHSEHVVMCSPAARIHVARGEHDLAVAVAHRGLRELVGDAVRRTPLLAISVQAEIGRGDLAAARLAAAELAATAERSDSPALHGDAQLAAGRVALAQNDPGFAVTCFGAAERSFDRAERPLPAAVAALELARALAASGQRADAIVEARRASGTLTRLGADHVADQAAAVLRELGDATRVRSFDHVAAVGSLTRREAEVLALIREGLTNPQIGERLYISAKTAEHHVGRVLVKLGVKSRAEAAAVATSAGARGSSAGIGGSP
jgi:DNA-binding CsgD family transcriptional regulator